MEHMDQYEELYRAWIGEKRQNEYFEKMRKGGFSWPAFFIDALLLVTRKMFTEAIILVFLIYLINTVLGILRVPNMVYNVVYFALCVVLGFTYYYLYRWHIKRKIEKYQKQGLSYEEQLQIARTNGGDKITVGVVVMIIVEIALIACLTFGMITVLKIVYNADGIVNNPSNNPTNNTVGNTINNPGYEKANNTINNPATNTTNKTNTINTTNTTNTTNTNTTNTTINGGYTTDNKKSWYLDSVTLSYNENDWKEMVQGNFKMLKYKDTENYLAYLGTEDNGGLNNLKSQDFRDLFEQQMKQQAESLDQSVKYLYANWEDTTDDLCCCTICYSVDNPDTGEYGYMTFYCYFSESKVYCLMTIQTQSDYSFKNDAMEVIDTIKNNSQL